MEKTKNVLLAHAGVNDINRGCVALTLSVLYLLHKISFKKKVDLKIILSESGLGDNGKYTILINNELVDYYVYNSINTKGIKNKIRCILHLNRFLKDLHFYKSIDYIFNIGRGDSYSDLYGKERFYYTDEIHQISRRLKKSYCFLPQTIGPFENNDIKEIAKVSLRDSSMVMVRDKQSLECVRAICPEQINVREYIDVAFFLPFKKTVFNNSFINVGLNISAFMLMGGYTGNNQFGLVIDYNKTIRSIIDFFLSTNNVKLHLIGHVESGERFVESDYVVCRDLYYEYNHPNLVLADFFLGPIEAKNYISGMDFFMGARMHATIAAFSSCVPVVPMAYSRKFNGLFIDTLNYPHIVDMKKDSEEMTLNIIKDCFRNRDVLKRKEVEQMKSTVAEAGKRLEEDLCSLLNL